MSNLGWSVKPGDWARVRQLFQRFAKLVIPGIEADISTNTDNIASLSTAIDFDIPLISGVTWTTPGGVPTWAGASIFYQGETYTITDGAGTTSTRGVFWTSGAPHTFYPVNTPTYTPGKWYVAFFDGTYLYPVFQSSIIHGGLIQANTITASQIIVSSINTNDVTNGAGWTNNDVANAAQSTANTANSVLSNWGYAGGTTYIDGGNIYTGTLSASKITTGTLDASNVTITNLTASNINTGTLTLGGTVVAAGTIGSSTGYYSITEEKLYIKGSNNESITIESGLITCVNTDSDNITLLLESYSTASGNCNVIRFQRSHHVTVGTVWETGTDDYLGRIEFGGVNTNNTPALQAATIFVKQYLDAESTYVRGRLYFEVRTTGGTYNQMMLDHDGTLTVDALKSCDLDSTCTVPASTLTGTISGSNVSGGTFGEVNGSALTNLNASNLASGTVPDANLPTGTRVYVGNYTGSSSDVNVTAIGYPAKYISVKRRDSVESGYTAIYNNSHWYAWQDYAVTTYTDTKIAYNASGFTAKGGQAGVCTNGAVYDFVAWY